MSTDAGPSPHQTAGCSGWRMHSGGRRVLWRAFKVGQLVSFAVAVITLLRELAATKRSGTCLGEGACLFRHVLNGPEAPRMR